MREEDLLSRAESNIPEDRGERVSRKRSSGTGSRVKPVIASLLCLGFIAAALYAWGEIRRMNTPPEVPEEVLLENMGGYMFITVSKLNAYIEREGRVPAAENDFLGWDDPSVEYLVEADGYSVSIRAQDTFLVWHSGEDVSEFLTEDAVARMGIAN